MKGPPSFPTPYGYASASDVTWSRAEKAVARRAYDAALERELREMMSDEFKSRHGAPFLLVMA
jgi:hypothetical protein